MRFFKGKKMQAAVKSSKNSEKSNNINKKVANSSNQLNASPNKSPKDKKLINELAAMRF